MHEPRLSYRDFVSEYLLACVIAVDARTDILIDSELATRFVSGRHGEGWPLAAMRQLAEDGLLRGSYTIDQPPRFNLTGPGLARAEHLLEERGETLHDAIDRRDEKLIDLEGQDYAFVSPADTLVLDAREENEDTLAMLRTLLRLSEGARGLSRHVEDVVEANRRNTVLNRTDGIETTREQIDQEFQLLLVASLQWFYPRIRQDRLRRQVQKLLASAEKGLPS